MDVSVFQGANISKDSAKVMKFMDEDALSLSASVVQITILSLGITVNILLIVAHWKDPLHVFKNTTSLFVRNIAIIDIIVAFLWIIRMATMLAGRILETLSVIWLGFIVMSPCAFLCFAMERFLSVAFPLWYRVRVTIQICRKVLLGVWTVHAAIYVITCLVFNAKVRKNFTFLYGIIILLCVFAFYFATYVALRRGRNELRKRQDISEGTLRAMKARQEHEKRFLVTIAIICFILTVIFVPIVGIHTIRILLQNVLKPKRIRQINTALPVLLSVNFLVNPIIYLLRLPKYRKTFKVLYCNFTA